MSYIAGNREVVFSCLISTTPEELRFMMVFIRTHQVALHLLVIYVIIFLNISMLFQVTYTPFLAILAPESPFWGRPKGVTLDEFADDRAFFNGLSVQEG